jgi:hypothetical protein
MFQAESIPTFEDCENQRVSRDVAHILTHRWYFTRLAITATVSLIAWPQSLEGVYRETDIGS